MKVTNFYLYFEMDQICRLCLTVFENMACKISEETKILDKLSRLNIQILLNESLPSLACCDCSKKLDDFINYQENVIQNQYKLIELLKNSTDLDDFYQSLKRNFSQEIKAEIDMEDEQKDQYFHYESQEPINETKTNKTDQKNKLITKNNDKLIYCEPVQRISCTKTNQKEKKRVKLKKEKTDHRNDISNNITILTKKRKTKMKRNQIKITKEKLKKHKLTSKAKENSIETKNEVDEYTESTEIIKNDSEENSANSRPKNYDEPELKNIETPIFNENKIEITIKDNKCLTCFIYLPSNSELIKHYKTIHNNVDKENGGTDFVQNNSNITHGNEKNFTDDKSERPYNCKVCGRTFTSVYAIVRHARAHSDYSLSCSHGCGYSTVYRGALLNHEKRHENDFRYKCSTCGSGFHVKTWHDQHQNIHKNVKPFVCDVCGMAFHMSRYLTSHRSSVHMNSLRGVKRFLCPRCDLAFDNARSFRTHLEEHTGKKKFLCALCGKECSSSEQLKYHNNSHLGLKPFACSICNKRFAKKFNLSVHQRAHAGEKHLCQECGKHFAQRSTLLRHTRKCHPESKCKNESKSVINK